MFVLYTLCDFILILGGAHLNLQHLISGSIILMITYSSIHYSHLLLTRIRYVNLYAMVKEPRCSRPLTDVQTKYRQFG